MMTMTHQIGNINKKIKIILKVEILKLKSAVAKMENSLEGLHYRFEKKESVNLMIDH